MTRNEKNLLQAVALNLGVNQNDLYKLIKFESKWNPKAKNPLSSARGLIQFTDKTAKSLGYKNSLDLVTRHPTISDQLVLVERYLSQYRPFRDKQALYLSVFYPAARNWNSERLFPDNIRALNPGINTPGDYVRKVEGMPVDVVFTGGAAIILLAAIIAFYYNRKIEGREEIEGEELTDDELADPDDDELHGDELENDEIEDENAFVDDNFDDNNLDNEELETDD
jgi:hypothetical protein